LTLFKVWYSDWSTVRKEEEEEVLMLEADERRARTSDLGSRAKHREDRVEDLVRRTSRVQPPISRCWMNRRR